MNWVLVDAPLELAALLLAAPWYIAGASIATFVLALGLASFKDGEEIWWLVVPILIITLAMSGTSGLFYPFQHPSETLAFTLQYMLLGIVYAVFRWTHLSIREARRIKSSHDSLFNGFQQDCQQYSKYRGGTFEFWLTDKGYMSSISRSKMRLARWIVWWPFSLVGYFFSDLIVDFIRLVADFAYKLFGNSFRRLQRWIYSQYGVSAELLDYTTTNSTDLEEFKRKVK